MSDTPETDESFSKVQRNGLSPIIAYVYRDDMQKMEIERDQARRLAEHYRDAEAQWESDEKERLPWEEGGCDE